MNPPQCQCATTKLVTWVPNWMSRFRRRTPTPLLKAWTHPLVDSSFVANRRDELVTYFKRGWPQGMDQLSEQEKHAVIRAKPIPVKLMAVKWRFQE